MEIGDWGGTADLNDLYREIRARGLETNVAELDAFGFTVLPNILSPELTSRLRDAIVAAAERRIGRELDLENETSLVGGLVVPYLLFNDPAFAEALLYPPTLALISYLLGRSCQLFAMASVFKGPGGAPIPLHSDTGYGVPAPFAPYSHIANVNFALTDYSEAAGALAIVPGSHRLARQPMPAEAGLVGKARNPNAIAIEVPARSAIVWHGNTWHGSFVREVPGVRVHMTMAYVRQYHVVQEDYRSRVTDEFLERYGGRNSRMADLLGVTQAFPWYENGPGPEFHNRAQIGRSWHA